MDSMPRIHHDLLSEVNRNIIFLNVLWDIDAIVHRLIIYDTINSNYNH
jgi:hypothetical protein